MKASELIAELQKKVAELGDLDISADLASGTVVIVAAYDNAGQSLEHDDPGAEQPTRIHLH